MPSATEPLKPTVVIAGGSGFVGSRLRQGLNHRFSWVGLTRSEARSGSEPDAGGTLWKQCDLYSFPKIKDAIAGATYAVYLVHSMLPSSRLSQGSFEDLDLLLADNFARACAAAGVKQILYLGGLIPEDEPDLSPHLASRLEIEDILRSTGVPVTVLRAGLIFGPGGSSTRMLINLVRRLPVMVLPRWTRSRTQSIDIIDVVRAFDFCIGNPDTYGHTYDLASHHPRTYREMILDTAAVLGRKPLTIPFPFNSFTLSRGWVSLFSGVSPQLVNPLLESLRHNLIAAPNPVLKKIQEDPVPFETSVRNSISREGGPVPNPRSSTQDKDNRLIRRARRVRSVQRLPLPRGWNAQDVARHYGEWLTHTFRGAIQVNRDDNDDLLFQCAFPRLTLLRLSLSPLTPTGERQVFYITGGILARKAVDPPGRLEFRPVQGNRFVMAAIHGFVPALPWYIYNLSQARIHLWVMRNFGRYLERQAALEDGSSNVPFVSG